MKELDRTIVLCDSTQQERWDAYVQDCPAATMCHLFAWKGVIERAYRHRTYNLTANSGGRIVGLLPLVLVQRPFFGASLTSMPFLDYGGVCADDAETAQLLVDRARALMQERHCRTMELRQCEPSIRLGVSREDKVSMLLDLSVGADSIWKALPAKVRNQVRKAEKSGLAVCVGGGELLDEFYDIFAVNMRDLGSPVHDKAFFAEMCAVLGHSVRVTLVRDGQRTIGGLIALFFKDTMLVPWASSLREYFSKCPNNLLYWDAIQDGCKRGCSKFDFGRSTMGSGTYDFKKQWGAEPKQLHWQMLSVSGAAGATISTDDAKYRFLLELWRRLPVSMTRLIGPKIRRYLTN
ncbi:MAG: FemAB family PEP-CTERM system-associated protein [Nitrospira sp.]|nr:MAG: FemAB family PEP-CTERM system-associated protein [Nitrospira sp.]